MSDSQRRFLAFAGLATAFLLALAAPVLAQDTCSVKAVLGGKAVLMKHCAVSLYDSEHSVSLYFSDAPFTPKEVEAFQEYSNPSDKDAAGKPRTAMHFAFCPGAGKPVVGAAAVKSVETGIDVAGSPFLGRNWVFDLPKDKDILKIEKLSGELKPGGRLTGRIIGGKLSDGLKYSWEADFDFHLPAKSAFGGLGCGP
jgi:hypothetical protein